MLASPFRNLSAIPRFGSNCASTWRMSRSVSWTLWAWIWCACRARISIASPTINSCAKMRRSPRSGWTKSGDVPNRSGSPRRRSSKKKSRSANSSPSRNCCARRSRLNLSFARMPPSGRRRGRSYSGSLRLNGTRRGGRRPQGRLLAHGSVPR